MLLTLKEDHQNHLQFLTRQSSQVLQDFCQLAAQHIEKGPNLKTYASAAQKLEVAAEDIRRAVEALVLLSVEASRFQVTEEELGVTLLALGFQSPLREQLAGWVLTHSPAPLALLRPIIPHYVRLSWRLEARMASRSLLTSTHAQAQVVLLLQLSTGQKVVLQATPAVLRHVAASLESALAEAGSRHCRRALRSIK